MGNKSFEGKDKQGGVIAAGAFIFAPLLLIKGKEAVIPKGKKFSVFIDRDYLINPTTITPSVIKNDSLKNNVISIADELKKLKELYDNKTLTKEEYENAKRILLK